VVPISRFLEKEPTSKPVRKPETQKARTSSTRVVIINRAPYLIGLIKRDNCAENAEKSGKNMNMHSTTPVAKTQVGLITERNLLIRPVDILSLLLWRNKGGLRSVDTA
jgi:hypothetical protein